MIGKKRGRGWTVYVERTKRGWRCRWEGRLGEGQQSFAFKADAEEFRTEKLRDFQRMDAGLTPALKTGTGVTVGEWWERYSETKRRENPETFRRFDTPALTPFIEKFSGVALAAISDDNVQKYKYALEDKYEGDTPQMYYRQVCAFFNAAVRAGKLGISPAKGIKKPVSGGGGGRALLDAELIPLLTLAPEALFRTGTFSLNTFLRINEIVMFDWKWVWELELPAAPGHKPAIGWMGRIPSELRKTRAKTTEDCVFPINAAARAVMGDRQKAGLIFPYSMSTIQHQVANVRKKAKLPDDVTFHCFRHTGASRYLGKDGPDGGHMEDLLETHIWEDPRSLKRYAHPSHATLSRRFGALSYPSVTPKSKSPPAARPEG